MSDQPYLVVGVMPPHFRLPLGKADMWIPYVQAAGSSGFGASVLARLKPGVTAAAAETELTAMLQTPPGMPGRWQVRAMWPGELAGATFRRALMVLLGAVASVLLIGCANIAGLLLARHASRAREIAIRAALGATRARLVWQLLTESLLLSGMGGAAGLLVGIWLLDVLALIRPAQMDQLAAVRLSSGMFVVAAILAVVTGLLFGVAPALAGTRERLEQALRQSARVMAHRRGTLARRVLTVAEVALACVLLTGAALLIRSYGRLLATSPGFQPERRISLHIALPPARYPDSAARGEFFTRLLAQTRALPGVESASLAGGVPPNGGLIFGTLEIEGQTPVAPAAPSAFSGGPVSPGFFRTLGIPLIEGRDFVDRDPVASPVIVNRTAAQRWWPGQSALGRRLRLGAKSPWRTVVAVAGDISSTAAFSDVQIYQPLTAADAEGDATLVVAASGDPASLSGALKGQVWSIDPRLPVTQLQTLDAAMAETLSRPRFNVLLLTAFAAAGLLLAAIGIYGVISYSVGQRTAEIGLRMALGAVPRDIRRSVIGEAAMLAAGGLTIGAGAALMLVRVMSALLYEVSAADPVSFLAAGAVLATTAMVAAWVPARRAMRVDPAIALRAE